MKLQTLQLPKDLFFPLGDLLFQKYKDSQIRIKDHFKLVRGKTPSTKNPEYYENGTLPWLDGGGLNGLYFLSDETKPSKMITESAKNELNLPAIQPNSIIFSNVNTYPNKICLVKTSKPFYFSNHVWQLMASNSYEVSCLFFSLRQADFKTVSTGTCFSEVNATLFLNTKINWVSDPEKQKIFYQILINTQFLSKIHTL